ncbi:hypothetical protein Y1Q_0005667 [Alligator mississippiensis]|uniref:Uncharacterized protein n=1 Tax=Alligator mississippiensis TaxID=8496 RepID=A0A151MFF1_ALLMI|nr:hypothetical protein Y1Q_0005667 [Alligator mississippiensis]
MVGHLPSESDFNVSDTWEQDADSPLGLETWGKNVKASWISEAGRTGQEYLGGVCETGCHLPNSGPWPGLP